MFWLIGRICPLHIGPALRGEVAAEDDDRAEKRFSHGVLLRRDPVDDCLEIEALDAASDRAEEELERPERRVLEAVDAAVDARSCDAPGRAARTTRRRRAAVVASISFTRSVRAPGRWSGSRCRRAARRSRGARYAGAAARLADARSRRATPLPCAAGERASGAAAPDDERRDGTGLDQSAAGEPAALDVLVHHVASFADHET